MSEEPYSQIDFLKRQVSRFLVVEQQLNRTRNLLDRDRRRFAEIQAFTQRVLPLQTISEFGRETVEAIVRIFELECSALILFERPAEGRGPPKLFAFDESFERSLGSNMASVLSYLHSCGHSPSLVRVVGGAAPWDVLGLHELVFSPVVNGSGVLIGVLFGGNTTAKKHYYDSLTEEILPALAVFSQQMSSLLVNFETRRIIHRHVEQLSHLHAVAASIASLFDRAEIAGAATTAAVDELGYDRAFLVLCGQGIRETPRAWCSGCSKRLATALSRAPLPAGQLEELFRTCSTRVGPLLVDGIRCRIDLEAARTLGLHCYVLAGLQADNTLTGALLIDNERSGRAFAPSDLDLIGSLAAQVSAALERTSLVRKIADADRLSAIGKMAAGIAHEIRNPLSAIATMVDILADRSDGAPTELLRGIEVESRRLQDILTRFLSYAQPYQPVRKRCNVNLVLEEISSLLEGGDTAREHRIVRKLDPQARLVLIDPDEMKQVFWNLVLNALQAVEGRSGVEIRSTAAPDGVWIDIVDSGPGIPAEALGRIFDPFYSTKPGGTGLGLPIARKIVEAHGGSLCLANRQPTGVRASLFLPY